MESHLTKIEGVPDSAVAVPGMAFFAGTGPAGATCGKCIHRGYRREAIKGTHNEVLQQMVHKSYRVTKCAVYRRMAGRHGTDIKSDCAACKYFEPKPK